MLCVFTLLALVLTLHPKLVNNLCGRHTDLCPKDFSANLTLASTHLLVSAASRFEGVLKPQKDLGYK